MALKTNGFIVRVVCSSWDMYDTIFGLFSTSEEAEQFHTKVNDAIQAYWPTAKSERCALDENGTLEFSTWTLDIGIPDEDLLAEVHVHQVFDISEFNVDFMS